MPSSEYIKQLTSPSLKVVPGVPTPPHLFNEYFASLESMRMEFAEFLTGCDEKTIRAFLRELEDAIRAIGKRPFATMSNADINALMMSGEESVALDFRESKLMDTELLKSAKKMVAFINTVLGVRAEGTLTEQPQPTVQPEEPTVYSGVAGLAKALGCGKTKANEIIQSNILKDLGIQYAVGRTWKFNAKKLSEYLREHPDFLR